MALDDILKPKSKEEIEDLERRGFRNTGKWRFNINIRPLISAFEETEDTEAFRLGIIELLKSKKDDIRIFTNDEQTNQFQKIIRDFEKMEESPSADELDEITAKLYDWADDNDVWIESF